METWDESSRRLANESKGFRSACVMSVLLGAVLAFGVSLRLMWPDTIEYKEDEAWLFRLVSNHCVDGDWAALGMPSSQHVKVPGLSVWVFYPLGHLFGVAEPTALAGGVAWCNIAALVGLVILAIRCVPAAEREPWLWAAALIAVNPMAVIYDRKLWPPCILPIFCVAFIAGWWGRDRPRGAFVWGLVGASLGQIHASGFLFAFAVILTTLAAAGRGAVRWGWWLAGSMLGALPMIGWLRYLAGDRDPMGANALEWHRWVEGKFWFQWVSESLGLGVSGVFGADYADFLRWPLIAGRATYAAFALQVLTGLLGAATIALVIAHRRRRRLGIARTSSGLLVRAGFACFGLMLTLAAVRCYRHYLIVTFPLIALWLARVILPDGVDGRPRALGRRLLAGICAVNAVNCVLMLSYLHANGGTVNGDFGPSYAAQVDDGGMRPPTVWLPIDDLDESN